MRKLVVLTALFSWLFCTFASAQVDFVDDKEYANDLGVQKVNPYNEFNMDESDLDFEDIKDIDEAYEREISQDNSTPIASSVHRMSAGAPPPQNNSVSQPPVTVSKGLTDSFADVDTAAAESAPLEGEEGADAKKSGGTWISKLTSSNPLSPTSLEDMVQESKTNIRRRSNASVFDISGLMLRMSVKQVESIMQNRGYKKIMEKKEVPNFIKWRNEETCRGQGVIGYERLASCVMQIARKDGHEYVDTIQFAKYDSQEEITVKFTSNFTNNKAYNIDYKSMSSNITGNSQKALYIRNIKIYDFWKKINQKYGAPDDRDSVIWGLGDNKPYLRASTGRILLEDPMLRELDYTRMSREDQRYMNTNLYNF